MILSGAFFRLTDWPNLLCAFHKAAKGKRGKVDVAAFETRLEDRLPELQSRLRARTWTPGGYHSFPIHDPKRRLISAAPFADRVVHHALCNLLEPEFERGFVVESFANRLGKGNHRALDAAQRHARRFAYVLQLDVRRFFPSMDHAVLLRSLRRKIADPDILWLIERILASGDGLLEEEADREPFPGDDLLARCRPRGLPIGNLTSQFWANVYLNPLDHCVKRELRCRGYVRYVDDMLLFADDKALLGVWKQRLTDRLADLRLHLHAGAHPRPVTEGFGFLGFEIFPDRRRLKRRKAVQYRQRLRDMIGRYGDGALDAESLVESVLAWNNHAAYGNTLGLRKAVFSALPPEIAAEAARRYRRSLKGRGGS
jgi:RNA-directed DNA polymerase